MKFLGSMLIVVSIIGTVSTPVLASSNKKQNKVHGRATITMNFSKSETSDAKAWMSDGKATGEKYIQKMISTTTDPNELSLLNEALKESQKINVNNLFKVNNDNSSSLVEPIANGQVSIDGQVVNTDQQGNYSVQNLDEGNHTVTVSYDGGEVSQNSISITGNNNDITENINSDVNSEDIVTAAKEMSDSMASEQGIRYYQHYANRTALSYGSESMTIVNDSDVVSCNEISSNSSSSSDIKSHLGSTNFSSFPFNGSDCATSIALGSLALSSPVLNLLYHNSVYCDIEAAQAAGRRMHLSSTNIYCNGTNTNKSGHYNCSWFFGIGNPERLHTD
jgi:hypothetical protein